MNVVEQYPIQAPLAASELNEDFLKANQFHGAVCVVCDWCFVGGWGVVLPAAHLAVILYTPSLSCNWARILKKAKQSRSSSRRTTHF